LKCKCGESVIIESAVKSAGGAEKELSLLSRCSVKGCQEEPLVLRTGYIKNVLTLAFKAHLQRFYQGWMSCEDPACEGEPEMEK